MPNSIKEILAEIAIPAHIGRKDYPKVVWTEVDGNAFAIIGMVARKWQKVDEDVASRIRPALMQSGSYEELLAVALTICPAPGVDDEDA